MLVRFTVSNYRSYKESTTLYLNKGSERLNSNHVRQEGGLGLLKLACLFGANASGKTNLVKAIGFMKETVSSGRIRDGFQQYYRLDPEMAKKESKFEMIFTMADGKVLRYCFSAVLNEGRFVEERLSLLVPAKGSYQEDKIFDRSPEGAKFFLEGLAPEENSAFDTYRQDIEENPRRLFLQYLVDGKSRLYQSKSEKVRCILETYRFFVEKIRIYDSQYRSFANVPFDDEEAKAKLGELLRHFDTGIVSVGWEETEEGELRAHRFSSDPYLLDQIKSGLASSYRQEEGNAPSAMVQSNQGYFFKIEYDPKKHPSTGGYRFQELVFHHQGSDTKFYGPDESEGTRKILALSSLLLQKGEEGDVFVIDELDNSLHPMMVVEFVRMYLQQAEAEGYRNQLIVSTHESHLLDYGMLRRDEVWFAKKENGQSELYSLEEFNERFDRRLEKAYLHGRYGGIPVFDEVFFPDLVKVDEAKEDQPSSK